LLLSEIDTTSHHRNGFLLKRLLITMLAGTMAAAAVPAPADNRLPTIGDPANSVMTPTAEAQLGSDLMREVRQKMRLVSDPELVAYVEDLGRRLTSHADTPEFHYHFFLVNSNQINAFAMPGGYVGVNTGLILAAENESELAGVLSHEIAHVAQRHMARQMAQAQQVNARTIALVLAGLLLGSQNPQAGSAAVMSSVAGAQQQQLAYSRQHEREADRIGMQILASSGFDPHGMGDFFKELMRASRYQDHPPPFLSTHPMTQERVADAEERADQLHSSGDFSTGLFALMRAKLRVLQAGSPEEAIKHFRNGHSLDQMSEADRFGYALALRKAGDYKQARRILSSLMKSQGENPPYLLAQAELEHAAGRYDEAVKAFDNALSLYPDSYPLRFSYAETLLDAGKPKAAVEQADKLLHAEAQRPALYRLKANAADKAGDVAEAKLAMAHYYRLEGDINSAMSQLRQVSQTADASDIQRSRAKALEREWKKEFNDKS